jgi:hypothetical protein
MTICRWHEPTMGPLIIAEGLAHGLCWQCGLMSLYQRGCDGLSMGTYALHPHMPVRSFAAQGIPVLSCLVQTLCAGPADPIRFVNGRVKMTPSKRCP